MEHIRVTTAVLTSEANRLDEQAVAIQSHVNNIVNLGSGIGGSVWSGEAASAYNSQISQLEFEASEMQKFLAQMAEKLRGIVVDYDTESAAVQGLIAGLPTNIIEG